MELKGFIKDSLLAIVQGGKGRGVEKAKENAQKELHKTEPPDGERSKSAIQKTDDKKVVDTIYLKWKAPNGQAYRAIIRNSKGDSIGGMEYTGKNSQETLK